MILLAAIAFSCPATAFAASSSAGFWRPSRQLAKENFVRRCSFEVEGAQIFGSCRKPQAKETCHVGHRSVSQGSISWEYTASYMLFKSMTHFTGGAENGHNSGTVETAVRKGAFSATRSRA